MKKINKPKKTNKFIFWTPRILAILFILFLALFSLDVFENCNGFLECTLALFMHNLPSLILLVILIISWKHDLIGGIIFTILGSLCVIGVIIALIISPINRFNPILIIGGTVFLLIGILFLVGWKKHKLFKHQSLVL